MMRILRRALVPPAFVVLAVLAQVTIVNRLPLPGDASPDLVLLVVAALAVTGGPVPGMLAGHARSRPAGTRVPAGHGGWRRPR